MAEPESESQKPDQRIVLVDPNNNSFELVPNSQEGSKLLKVARAVFLDGINRGKLETNPFTMTDESAGQGESAPNFSSRLHTLELATTAYRNQPQNPELLSEFYQALWDYRGVELMGLPQRDTRVLQAPYKEYEIGEFMKLDDPQPGNPGVDLPYFHLPILASEGPEARVLIGRGFDNLGAVWAFQERSGSDITNGHHVSGWMRVDASLDAPYRTDQDGKVRGLPSDKSRYFEHYSLKDAIKDDKRIGQTINIYGPSGNVIKTIFGYYPDQGLTSSRLPESRSRSFYWDRVIDAHFTPRGSFREYSTWPDDYRSPYLGGRSFLI